MTVFPQSGRWPRRCTGAGLVLLVLAGSVASATGQELLVDRTVAIVGGAVITRSDVLTALALGLVEAAGPEAERDAAARLVDRWLILHEVARFAPPEPPPAAIDARLAAIAAHAGSPAVLAATLARGGFTPARLAAWVRDDLRIAAYLDQRFATAGMASATDVAAYAENHAADLAAAGIPPADRLAVARDRLQAERRRELVADWLADLRRRTPVVEIPD
ncbi:MAG: hypothetical protein AB7U83_03320 [Vicinamibacterales bacterium]